MERCLLTNRLNGIPAHKCRANDARFSSFLKCRNVVEGRHSCRVPNDRFRKLAFCQKNILWCPAFRYTVQGILTNLVLPCSRRPPYSSVPLFATVRANLLHRGSGFLEISFETVVIQFVVHSLPVLIIVGNLDDQKAEILHDL